MRAPVQRLFWPQEKLEKTKLSTDAGMDPQPLKEALPEGGIPSTVI